MTIDTSVGRAASFRVEELLPYTDPRYRDRLRSRLRAADDDALIAALIDPALIRARANALEPRLRERLEALLREEAQDNKGVGRKSPLRELAEEGLVLKLRPVVEDELPRVALPLETRLALFEPAHALGAPLALHLCMRPEEELEEIANFLGEPDPLHWHPVGTGLTLARMLLEPERLRSLFDSLNPPTQQVLSWCAQAPMPLHRDALSSFLQRDDAAPPAAQPHRLLYRLGLLHAADDETWVLPPDASDALRRVIRGAEVQLATDAFLAMRDNGQPSRRDDGPLGVGLNPLYAARTAYVQIRGGSPPAPNALVPLLDALRGLDPAIGDAEFTSHLLDVDGTESFARHTLRTWAHSMDDPWTNAWVSWMGGDAPKLVESLLAMPQPEDEEEDDERWAAAFEAWRQFLHLLRGRLLFAFTLLPPLQWYPLEQVSNLVLHISRVGLVCAEGFPSIAHPTLRGHLPVTAAELNGRAVGQCLAWTLRFLREVLEPLGVGRVDEMGTMVQIDPERCRVQRSDDLDFEALWSDAEELFGDEVDLWLHMPTDPGPKVTGVARLEWEGEALVVPADAHVHDLRRLGAYGRAGWHPLGWSLHFSPESVEHGLAMGEDPERFLLWLRARTDAAIPPFLRTLFPLTSTDADRDDGVESLYASQVRDVLHQMSGWAGMPPLLLAEEVRSWGRWARGPLMEGIEPLLSAPGRNRLELQRYAVLLGEIGDPAAGDAMLRLMEEGADEHTEAAAACALARLGAPLHLAVAERLRYPGYPEEKRQLMAATLSTLAALHPSLCSFAFETLASMLRDEVIEPELATIFAIHLAETGHPGCEDALHRLRESHRWTEEVMPWEEVTWLLSFAPTVFGHRVFMAPLAQIFPSAAEGHMASYVEGVNRLLAEEGLEADRILGPLDGRFGRRRRQ